MHFVKSYEAAYGVALSVLLNPCPVFLGRVGGSDTSAIADYLMCKTEQGSSADLESHVKRYLSLVENYNGFYDRSKNVNNYMIYCETLISSYQECRVSMFCNYQLLSIYFGDMINKQFYNEDIPNRSVFINLVKQLDQLTTDRIAIPYMFAEKMVFDKWTLFRAFAATLTGKKVLVVSPFSESINKNFHNRKKFFKNFDYPELDLITYNAPVTYAGLPDEYYPDSNWHETLARMKSEISQIQFDIALFACGSYAMPLGVFCEKQLQRRSIYVGGVLQLFFGVLGRRYDNSFFTDQINRDAFIWPVEREHFLKHVTVNEHTAAEAFGAYF